MREIVVATMDGHRIVFRQGGVALAATDIRTSGVSVAHRRCNGLWLPKDTTGPDTQCRATVGAECREL
jgi:hypothetical protein